MQVAEAVLRIIGRPAHFREVTDNIATHFREIGSVNERTVHNALVTNQHRFVWVKSGTYGLIAWGLKKPPFIKDPLQYWHLKEKVLEVCNCKEESVRMTLDLNPRVFRKFEKDQYGMVEHYESATSGRGKAETS